MLCTLFDQLAHAIDDVLGLGAWHQHTAPHGKHTPVELTPAQDVVHRLALAAAHQEITSKIDLHRRDGALQVEEQPQAVQLERIRHQQLGLKTRTLDALALQVRTRHRQHRACITRQIVPGFRHRGASVTYRAFRRSSRSMAATAATTGSSLPARTCSSEKFSLAR